ncbi:universal stress protein [Salegentibacter sp. Hel_I_6]|uniref:universal stress protein n=1 Tax=Salegentibacter sp. Hel_I_6 TaxID=1250278 RepID=UPI000563C3C4|nr:universal stress protein [Salegentibacter sp. Hel_I_6]
MKYILIPTDFSESAINASEFGIEMAKFLKLPIRFLHSVKTPVDWQKLNLKDESKYPETKERINTAKDQLKTWEKKAENNGIEAEHILIYNTGLDELINYTNPENYELVIMGTHGAKGFEKILGSNTQKLIRHSEVPVLAIKHKVDLKNLSNILIATDFLKESKNAFEKVYKLLKKLKIKITLVYINTAYNFKETGEIDEMISIFLDKKEWRNLEVERFNANNEARGIGMAINKLKPDLFTSISHKRSGFNTIFSPSITEEIINNYHIPVLSINREI